MLSDLNVTSNVARQGLELCVSTRAPDHDLL